MKPLEERRAERAARLAGAVSDAGAQGTRDDLQMQAEKTVDAKNKAAEEKDPPKLASREPGAPTRARKAEEKAKKVVPAKADAKTPPNPFPK